MWAAEGVLTARGGMTSHAAVVARGWGKPCICGTNKMRVNEEKETVTFELASGEVLTLKAGDYVSLNGDTGEILVGKQPLIPPSLESPEVLQFMKWVDAKRKIRVLANAGMQFNYQLILRDIFKSCISLYLNFIRYRF